MNNKLCACFISLINLNLLKPTEGVTTKFVTILFGVFQRVVSKLERKFFQTEPSSTRCNLSQIS